MRQVTSMSQPPPPDTLAALPRLSEFRDPYRRRLAAASAWTNGEIAVDTPAGPLPVRFRDLRHRHRQRPEGAAGACGASPTTSRCGATCSRRRRAEEDAYLARTPYLGAGFEFSGKTPQADAFLKNIHNFTYGATLSMGLSASSISGMKYGIPRLVSAVVGALFREDSAYHLGDCRTTPKS